MNGAFYISGLGLDTQQRALDTIANNIANINTHSFKRSSVRFSEIISALDTQAMADGANFNANLMDTNVYGVRSNVQTHFAEQGDLELTGNTMDIAVQGEGFIAVSYTHLTLPTIYSV